MVLTGSSIIATILISISIGIKLVFIGPGMNWHMDSAISGGPNAVQGFTTW